jgi:hypothetical protein
MNATMRLRTLRLQPRHSLSAAAVMAETRSGQNPAISGQQAFAGRFPIAPISPSPKPPPGNPPPPTLHDLQPRDVFRELLQEKHIEGDELTAVFDELLALRDARVTV